MNNLASIDWEDAGYKFCSFVTWTAPQILVDAAGRWRWEWRAMTGTLYPAGVFVLAFYLVFFVLLLAAITGSTRLLRHGE